MYYCKPRGSHVVVTDQDFKAVSFFLNIGFQGAKRFSSEARVYSPYSPLAPDVSFDCLRTFSYLTYAKIQAVFQSRTGCTTHYLDPPPYPAITKTGIITIGLNQPHHSL